MFVGGTVTAQQAQPDGEGVDVRGDSAAR